MATTHKLPNPHFLSMPPADRMDLILTIRAARRVATPIPRNNRAKPVKATPSVDRQIEQLTSEQALRLMELLSNGD